MLACNNVAELQLGEVVSAVAPVIGVLPLPVVHRNESVANTSNFQTLEHSGNSHLPKSNELFRCCK